MEGTRRSKRRLKKSAVQSATKRGTRVKIERQNHDEEGDREDGGSTLKNFFDY